MHVLFNFSHVYTFLCKSYFVLAIFIYAIMYAIPVRHLIIKCSSSHKTLMSSRDRLSHADKDPLLSPLYYHISVYFENKVFSFLYNA